MSGGVARERFLLGERAALGHRLLDEPTLRLRCVASVRA